MQGFILGFIMIWLALTVPAAAETIYTWTDQDGIKRFSNEQPPEGVKVYQKETVSSSDTANAPVEKRRSDYDRMVEGATVESRHLEQRRKAAEAAKAAELQRREESHRQNQLDTQRRQLEKKIEAIRKRALSTTYSKGMQNAQIEEIQQQINQLKGPSETHSAENQESTKDSE